MARVRQPSVKPCNTTGAKKPASKDCPQGTQFVENGIMYIVMKISNGSHRWMKVGSVQALNAPRPSQKPVAKPATKPISQKAVKAPKASGCAPSTLKKYTSRPSPPYPAAECQLGMKLQGKDGIMYQITATKTGVHRWTKMK